MVQTAIRARALVIAVLLTVLSLAGLARPAQAADYRYQVVGTSGMGVCQRTEPRLAAPRAGCIGEGGWVTVNCWVIGDTVTDVWQGRTISWNRWARTPANLFIADIYLSSSSTSYPQCAAAPALVTRESKAVDWARGQLGVWKTTLTPDGMWSGWCERFVEIAYGTTGRYPSAIADYNAQRAAGRISTSMNPPAGALVFYNLSSYGHVGVSIGGGQVISTKGINTWEPVRQHGVTDLSGYLGWSYAPMAWPGR